MIIYGRYNFSEENKIKKELALNALIPVTRSPKGVENLISLASFSKL